MVESRAAVGVTLHSRRRGVSLFLSCGETGARGDGVGHPTYFTDYFKVNTRGRRATQARNKKPSLATERVCELVGESYTARTTLPAWKPLGPLSRSNSTVSPSFSER